MTVASQNAFLEKGRLQDAGASSGQTRGVAPREQEWSPADGIQSSKLHGTLPHISAGSLPSVPRGKRSAWNSRKSSSQKAKSTSLPPLTRSEMIRATQEMICDTGIADAIEQQSATPRAVESQRNGDSSISTLNLINWGRRNPRVRAHIARLIGLPDGVVTDPDFMEGAQLVADYFARQAEPQVLADEIDAGEILDPALTDLFGSAS